MVGAAKNGSEGRPPAGLKSPTRDRMLQDRRIIFVGSQPNNDGIDRLPQNLPTDGRMPQFAQDPKSDRPLEWLLARAQGK